MTHNQANQGQAPEFETQQEMGRKSQIGDTVRYQSWGKFKTGKVRDIGKSGIVFLENGQFLFPQSILRD
jgi:hypothetical protein